MRKISFPLLHSVRLTPLTGAAEVDIQTTGDVLITEYKRLPHPRRAPYVHIADTKRASLVSSPKGRYLTMKIILPVEIASEREFHRQVSLIYDEMMIDRI